MTDLDTGSPRASGNCAPQRTAPASTVMPTGILGWLAVALTASGIAGLLAVMNMARIADDPAAIDSRLMITSIVLVISATVSSALCVSLWKQRSVLNLLALVASLGALGLVAMLGLGGFFNGAF